MADNLPHWRPEDRLRINVHEEREVEYWAKRWDITKARLIETVETCGTRTAAVARMLAKAW